MSEAMVRKVRDRVEARALLAEWEASGERMSSWCAARGISWYSLSACKGWTRRSGPRLVEVEVGGTLETARSEATYTVVIGDLRVEVDDDFRADTLQRLLRTVASC